MAPARLRLPLLLPFVLLLLSAVPLLAFGLKENKVKDDVGVYLCLEGQYFVNGSCKTCPKGTYMDSPNNATACKPCIMKCGIQEELDDDYTSCSQKRCRCKEKYCKDSNHTEACVLCPSGNHTDRVSGNVTSPGPAGTMDSGGHNHGTRKPPPVNTKGQHSDATHTLPPPPARTTGSFSHDHGTRTPHPENTTDPTPQGSRNHLLNVLFLLLLLPIFLCWRYRRQLRDWWVVRRISGFQDPIQPQGLVHNVGGSDPRNSFEMRTVRVDTRNGQCNAEEIHNLMPGGHSDSASPVVLEVMPQSGPPETPPPDQVTMEQEQGCISVASSS